MSDDIATALKGLTLDDLLDALADRIVAKLAAGAPAPRYADCQSNPYGSKRAFLDAARRGEFKTFLRVRRTTAVWSDVERAIETKARGARSRVVPQEDLDAAELEAAGVRLRPKAKPRR